MKFVIFEAFKEWFVYYFLITNWIAKLSSVKYLNTKPNKLSFFILYQGVGTEAFLTVVASILLPGRYLQNINCLYNYEYQIIVV